MMCRFLIFCTFFLWYFTCFRSAASSRWPSLAFFTWRTTLPSQNLSTVVPWATTLLIFAGHEEVRFRTSGCLCSADGLLKLFVSYWTSMFSLCPCKNWMASETTCELWSEMLWIWLRIISIDFPHCPFAESMLCILLKKWRDVFASKPADFFFCRKNYGWAKPPTLLTFLISLQLFRGWSKSCPTKCYLGPFCHSPWQPIRIMPQKGQQDVQEICSRQICCLLEFVTIELEVYLAIAEQTCHNQEPNIKFTLFCFFNKFEMQLQMKRLQSEVNMDLQQWRT